MYKEAKENEEEEKNSLAKKNEGEKKNSLDEEIDPSIPVPQPPYLFGSSQVELMLETDVEYYIIPSLRKRNQPGNFFLHVRIINYHNYLHYYFTSCHHLFCID
jgi:hypothetical protein